jgi:UDP-N-acetylmuramate dehydrogenase
MKQPWATTRTIKKNTLVRILLRGEMGASNVLQNEPMSKYTSFRVGGPADWLLRANDTEMLIKAVYAARRTKLPYRIIGAGSNILVSDAGIEGIVILNKADDYELIEYQHGFVLMASSGVMLPKLAGELAKHGAAGLEWGVGIPGTIGGAVVQNAGAWGHEIKKRLLSIEYIISDQDKVKTIPANQLGLRYRGSNILDVSPQMRPIILNVWFRLDRDEPEAIMKRNAEYIAQRQATQPRLASGGSTFRNPTGDYAGRLLQATELKGYSLGRAAFSKKHANFIVNYDNATASDIRTLIELGQERVQTEFEVELELELEYVGYWGQEQATEINGEEQELNHELQ